MPQTIKILGDKKLRSVWDASKKTWWVSVIDVIAALRNTDYDTSRNYLKQIKSRINNETNKKPSNKKNKLKISYQIKLTCKDNKQRYTDVMRYEDIIQLIQILPIGIANALSEFKKIIGSLASKTKVMANIFNAACIKHKNLQHKKSSEKELVILQSTIRQTLF